MTVQEAARNARRRLIAERVQRDLKELGHFELALQVRAATDREERLLHMTSFAVPGSTQLPAPVPAGMILRLEQ